MEGGLRFEYCMLMILSLFAVPVTCDDQCCGNMAWPVLLAPGAGRAAAAAPDVRFRRRCAGWRAARCWRRCQGCALCVLRRAAAGEPRPTRTRLACVRTAAPGRRMAPGVGWCGAVHQPASGGGPSARRWGWRGGSEGGQRAAARRSAARPAADQRAPNAPQAGRRRSLGARQATLIPAPHR